MFDTPILNLVILLSFTYFIGSLMLSAIVEFIAGLRRSRGKALQASMHHLLLDEEWVSFAPTLMKSQHIRSLQHSKGGFPSYIPAENFYMALIDQICPAALAEAAANNDPARLDAAITASTLPKSIKEILAGLLAKARANHAAEPAKTFAAFQAEVGLFFNNAMDRASGDYKRTSRRIQFFVAFGVAVALNIDTIKITRDSLSDVARLSKTVENIAAKMENVSSADSVWVVINGKEQPVIAMAGNRAPAAVCDCLDTPATHAKKKIVEVVETTGDGDLGRDTLTLAAQSDKLAPSTNSLSPSASDTQDASAVIRSTNALRIFYNSMGSPFMGYSDWGQFREEWIGSGNCDGQSNADSATVVATQTEITKKGKANADTTNASITAEVKTKPFGWFATLIYKLTGVLLTTFALQLGANYWFEKMNLLLNLRATGKKPEPPKKPENP